MKKLCILFFFPCLLMACNNQKNSNEKAGEDVQPYNQIGVKNVNGNIPDTMNAIDLSTNKVDSANIKADSLKK